MALAHKTVVYAVKTASIYPMTADPAAGTTTYGTGIVATGMKSIAVTKSYESKKLRGDMHFLDQRSVLVGAEAKIAYAKQNLDLRAVVEGFTVTDAGTTPNQTATAIQQITDVPGFFKIDAQCTGVDSPGQDYHVILYKCQVTGDAALGMGADEDFQLQALDCSILPCVGTGTKWIDEIYHETAVAPS